MARSGKIIRPQRGISVYHIFREGKITQFEALVSLLYSWGDLEIGDSIPAQNRSQLGTG